MSLTPHTLSPRPMASPLGSLLGRRIKDTTAHPTHTALRWSPPYTLQSAKRAPTRTKPPACETQMQCMNRLAAASSLHAQGITSHTQHHPNLHLLQPRRGRLLPAPHTQLKPLLPTSAPTAHDPDAPTQLWQLLQPPPARPSWLGLAAKTTQAKTALVPAHHCGRQLCAALPAGGPAKPF